MKKNIFVGIINNIIRGHVLRTLDTGSPVGQIGISPSLISYGWCTGVVPICNIYRDSSTDTTE